LPSRFWASRLSAAFIGIAAAGLATYSIHGATLGYGLDYDDYHFLRPYSVDEVLASFRGSWDRSGVMVPFYRPLTVAFSALRFELFGLNAVAHHAASLVMFALAAVLIGRLVYRITSHRGTAVLTVLMFACHPAMPYSLSAWITNQMHLLQMLVVLGAISWWDFVRDRRTIWWLPLLGFAIASFMVKEDGVMLLPAIVVLHEIRRGLIDRRLQRVPLAFVALSALAIAALIALRTYALGELGGYGKPAPWTAWRNVWTTLYGVFRLIPADREWQPAASVFSTVAPLIAIAGWRWISAAARVCAASGAALAIVFALPLIFGTKPEQVYMIGAGMALVLAGASIAMLDLAGRAAWPSPARWLAASIVAGGLLSLAAVTRTIATDFEPFGPMVLGHDAIVATWGHVAPELREYVQRKREPGARNHLPREPLGAVPVVTFNVQGRETSPDGLQYVWMSGNRAEIDVLGSAREITMPLRHAIDAFREPARVRVRVNGEMADEIVLDTTEWRTHTIALRPQTVPRIGRMHRIELAIDHAWRPADIIRGSTDGRILGIQIGMAIVK
jgi:hypothetical protein